LSLFIGTGLRKAVAYLYEWMEGGIWLSKRVLVAKVKKNHILISN